MKYMYLSFLSKETLQNEKVFTCLNFITLFDTVLVTVKPNKIGVALLVISYNCFHKNGPGTFCLACFTLSLDSKHLRASHPRGIRCRRRYSRLIIGTISKSLKQFLNKKIKK